MTAFGFDEPFAVPPSRSGVFAAFFRAINRKRSWRARQRTLIMLSRYDEHMLRDMGVNPTDVAEALKRHYPLSPLFYPIHLPTDCR